jgi:non-ribosomal peptide synthetase component E (peptide arylation enzyme)
MKSPRLVAVAGAVALLAPLGAAASAQAAEQVPFTITEQINFATGVTTFTATGPLCPSGTFADDVKIVAPNPESSGIDSSGTFNLLIRTVYTCDDGSGTFNALKHVFITFTENGFTNTGPIQLLGGTGAFTDLGGHGVNNGTTSGDTGVGQISGFVVQR